MVDRQEAAGERSGQHVSRVKVTQRAYPVAEGMCSSGIEDGER